MSLEVSKTLGFQVSSCIKLTSNLSPKLSMFFIKMAERTDEWQQTENVIGGEIWLKVYCF